MTSPRPQARAVFGVVELHDETLRDGLQCPSATDPPLRDKVAILDKLERLGITSTNVGLPGAGPRAVRDVRGLAQAIARGRWCIRPTCAARTLPMDIQPIVDIAQEVGAPIEVMAFIGSSPVRQMVEGWDLRFIRNRAVEAIDFAVRHGLPVTFVTEDTTRSHPAMLSSLFRAAMDHGATGLCLCDTTGHATPDGVRNLVRFVRRLVRDAGESVRIDWHGHNDRGLALANALAAAEAGADRIHGCVLGVGERVGNTALDLLILNLADRGMLAPVDTEVLASLCEQVDRSMRLPAHLGALRWWAQGSQEGAPRSATFTESAAPLTHLGK